MTARAPDPSELLPMVGDIVERNMEVETHTRAAAGAASPLTTHELTPAPALRPIQAVVGQAFPLVRTRRSYGRQSTPALCNNEATLATETATGHGDTNHSRLSSEATGAARLYTGLSAHVQPQDGTSAEIDAYGNDKDEGEPIGATGPRLAIPTGGDTAVLPVGGSAQQHLPAHQWSATEFEQLRTGYYVASLPPLRSPNGEGRDTTAAGTEAAVVTAAPPTGEDFFTLLFQCLRSTVRKHQQLALGVLLAHLQSLATEGGDTSEGTSLRERCLHGPNCGPFLFFLLEVLVSAGHPAMVELASTCLLLLLRDLPRGGAAGAADAPEASCVHFTSTSLCTEAIAELGNPAGDAPGTEEGDEEGEGETLFHGARHGTEKERIGTDSPRDDAALPFSEVSELLRGPDARYGLEQLGFTNKALAALPLLLYTDANTEEAESTAETAMASGNADPTPQGHRDTFSSVAAQLPVRHGAVLFLELLLCGGVGIGQRTACRRVAEDPPFLRWTERQLSAVVLGQRSLESVMELLCVLQHLAHAPAALRSLIRGGPEVRSDVMDATTRRAAENGGGDQGTVAAATAATLSSTASQQRQHQRFRETWLLFFLYVASTAEREVRTIRHVFAIMWSMLLLRLCVRQGRRRGAAAEGPAVGLVYDMSDTLLTAGMAVGGSLVLEMWFLQYVAADDVAGNLDGYFLDVARTTLQLCRRTGPTGDEGGEEATGETVAAQRLLYDFQWLTNAHFFATYVTHMRQRSPATCYTLCGSAVETQEAMRYWMRHVVLDPTRIANAFARFTSPLLSPCPSVPTSSGVDATMHDGGVASSPSAATVGEEGWAAAVQAVLCRWVSPSIAATAITTHRPYRLAMIRLASAAAALYANTRVAVALADVYPAVARDTAVGYATLLAEAYAAACLRLRDAAATRLQVDELCTMAEAVRLLQRCGDEHRASSTSLPRDAKADESGQTTVGGEDRASTSSVAEMRTDYDREARIGAFFLLHSIAISKHCLDVVPLILPLLRFHVDAAVPVHERMSLLASLQSGIELTPVPVMLSGSNSGSVAAAATVSGVPRSWVLYPLYDTTFTAKHVWASWLRSLLGLHSRVKDVVGWDGVLNHTLLWMLTHRRALWGTPHPMARTETAENASDADEAMEADVDPASAAALCALTVDLCAVLHDASALTTRVMSTAASRTLEVSLAAYSDVPSEEGLPRLVHAAVAYVAAHCSARAALAALQVLLATPVIPLTADGDPVSANGGEAASEGQVDTQKPGGTSSSFLAFSYASSTAQVCAWLASWSVAQGQQTQSANSVYWSLDDVVALVQLVGPYLGDATWGLDDAATATTTTADAWKNDGRWCVRCLTDGLLRYYLQQRVATSGALSAMEKAVLRSTLEEMEWFPLVLWSQVEM